MENERLRASTMESRDPIMAEECVHEWRLDFTESVLMWRCAKCNLGIVAKPERNSH